MILEIGAMKLTFFVIAAGLAAAIVLAAVLWFADRSIGSAAAWLRTVPEALDPQTAVILGVSSVVALLCAWRIAGAIGAAKRRETKRQPASDYVNVYQAALEALANRLKKQIKPLSASERTLFLKASAPVLEEYRLLLDLLSDSEATGEAINLQTNRLLLAMRRDCGYSTYNLEDQDWADILGIMPGVVSQQASSTPPRTSRPVVPNAGPSHRL